MISEQYKKQLVLMQTNKKFRGGLHDYHEVFNFIKEENPASVLDFGCARGNLISQLKSDFPNISFFGYDPGVGEFEIFPNSKIECLISNDVIEHIEPEFLDITLKKINNTFIKSARLVIACYPARKLLPDGRNSHLIVENKDWWLEKIKSIFTECTIEDVTVTEKAIGKPELQVVLRK